MKCMRCRKEIFKEEELDKFKEINCSICERKEIIEEKNTDICDHCSSRLGLCQRCSEWITT